MNLKLTNELFKKSLNYNHYFKGIISSNIKSVFYIIVIFILFLMNVDNEYIFYIFIFFLILTLLIDISFIIYFIYRINKCKNTLNDYQLMNVKLTEFDVTRRRDIFQFIIKININGKIKKVGTESLWHTGLFNIALFDLTEYEGKEVTIGYNEKTNHIMVFEKVLFQSDKQLDNNESSIDSTYIDIVSNIAGKCNYGSNIKVLTKSEKDVYICDTFMSEVDNGGFEQFIYNPSGAYYNLLKEAFTSIGIINYLNVYNKVLSYFPSTLPEDEEKRSTLLDSIFENNEDLSEEIKNCDKAFYNNEKEMQEAIYNYILNNKDSFNIK